MTQPIEVVSTGVPSFDVVLGGGIPRRHSVVVTGNPGAGKTILCSQLAFMQARAGRRTIIATITSEPHDKLIHELRGFTFFDEGLVGEEVFFVNVYQALKKGHKEARELLVQLVQSRRAGTLFVDGLRALRDLWQDEARLREFMHELTVGVSAADCNSVFSAEYDLPTLTSRPEATTVDGIVSLAVSAQGTQRSRRIEVAKLRGRAHLTGEHAVRIDERGVTITPRLESVTPPDVDYEPSEGRAGFGLPALDALMGGGLPRESGTLVVGSTGIGKTLLSLQFAADAARVGERALFVSFYEPPASLVRRSANVGLQLRPLLDAGALTIDYVPPMQLDADQLLEGVLARAQRLDVRRLVLDGMVELERALPDASRMRELLTALMIRLRRLKVTAIYTKELTRLAGDVDFSDTPVSLIAENLMFLRYIELRGTLRRILSVVKMRASEFDVSLREFTVGAEGLRVLEPLRDATGLLTGVAHLLPPGTATGELPGGAP